MFSCSRGRPGSLVEHPAVGHLADYLNEMHRIERSREASDETSFYPALANLLNAVGADLTPQVLCVITPRNRGAGIPDGGLFIKREAVQEAGPSVLSERAPERGVVEAKGLRRDALDIVRSDQAQRYLRRYGQVLVTNYREFLTVRLRSDGSEATGEHFVLADTPESFWALAASGPTGPEQEEAFAPPKSLPSCRRTHRSARRSRVVLGRLRPNRPRSRRQS